MVTSCVTNFGGVFKVMLAKIERGLYARRQVAFDSSSAASP
jgi:hypothetical protein